jgi:hypothetical protein
LPGAHSTGGGDERRGTVPSGAQQGIVTGGGVCLRRKIGRAWAGAVRAAGPAWGEGERAGPRRIVLFFFIQNFFKLARIDLIKRWPLRILKF